MIVIDENGEEKKKKKKRGIQPSRLEEEPGLARLGGVFFLSFHHFVFIKKV